MDKNLNFEDLAAGESISFPHLLHYLKQGREIEFTYDSREYFISHTEEGRAIWLKQEMVTEYISQDEVANFESVMLSGETIVNLCKHNKIRINGVF